MADPDLQIRGGGGGGRSSKPCDKGGGPVSKTFSRPFGPPFGPKIRGGWVPRDPPLDPPLVTVRQCSVLLCGRRKELQSIVEAS